MDGGEGLQPNSPPIIHIDIHIFQLVPGGGSCVDAISQ